jgi:DnaK suppressor protein
MEAERETFSPTFDETFMNDRQREHFRRRLLAWKTAILEESKKSIERLQADNFKCSDDVDRAASVADKIVEMHERDRERKLVGKIDAALRRIEDGTYGYCEQTGDPISLERLEARPIATLSIAAQKLHEHNKKLYR